MSLRYIDICSGISAPTLAWKPFGWRALCFSEIDPAPRAVLAHHYPDVPLRGDFTEIEGNEYGPVDLVVGGTPCQDFSVAGQRAGLGGERGNLTLQFGRLARRSGARWFVWENVPGVFSSHAGRDFGAVLASFAGYPAGTVFAPPRGGWRNSGVVAPAGPDSHGLAWRVLDAQHFGVPQRRRRVFVVGYIGDWRPAAAVLLERHSLSRHPAPRREARKGAAVGTLGGTSPGGGWRFGADEAAGGHLIAAALTASDGGTSGKDAIDGRVVPTLDASYGRLQGCAGQDLNHGHGHLVAHTLRAEGFDASEDGTGRGTPLVVGALAAQSFAGGSGGRPEGAAAGHFIAFNLTPSNSNKDFNARESERAQTVTAGGNRPSARGGDVIAFDCKASGQNGFGVGEIASTQRAMGHADSHTNGGGHQAAMVGSSVRRLTPRECERLQGVSDDFTLVPHRGKPMADGPRYKMLGNSMAVPVLEWIGRRIDLIESIIKSELAA